MDRSEFDGKFIEYRKHLRDEVHRFRDAVAVYRQIQERKSDQLEVINLAPAFFGVVEGALFSTIVLWADKLFDGRGERGFFNFLKFVEHNREWMALEELQRRRDYPDNHWMLDGRVPITFESIEEDRNKIRNLEALKSFRLRRDKFHGHFDKGYFFQRERFQAEAPIRWEGLKEVGELMGAILNRYSTDFDGEMYSWNTLNIEDLSVLLSKAGRAIHN